MGCRVGDEVGQRSTCSDDNDRVMAIGARLCETVSQTALLLTLPNTPHLHLTSSPSTSSLRTLPPLPPAQPASPDGEGHARALKGHQRLWEGEVGGCGKRMYECLFGM